MLAYRRLSSQPEDVELPADKVKMLSKPLVGSTSIDVVLIPRRQDLTNFPLPSFVLRLFALIRRIPCIDSPHRSKRFSSISLKGAFPSAIQHHLKEFFHVPTQARPPGVLKEKAEEYGIEVVEFS